MDIVIEKSQSTPVSQSSIEIVERKGLGHPDTLCDSTAEELSIALSRYYLKHFGKILHHNIDKCLLVGGHSDVSFGGGVVTSPIRMIIAGRAVENFEGKEIPLEEIAEDVTHQWLNKQMRYLEAEKNVIVETKIKTGSVDLRSTYNNTSLLANDTSLGVGFSPMTELENIVYHTEKYLNSPETKNRYPMIGEDIKIMGIRKHDHIHLTIAIAFISRFIHSKREYCDLKTTLLEYIKTFINNFTRKYITLVINAADNEERNIFYLTATGTSAECGDDGQVGRGNRANGLITPYRPMTLEATAGKNPITHTGKLYNLIAREICIDIEKETGISDAECFLVSQIGKPITEPSIVHVKIHTTGAESLREEKCRDIIKNHLNQIPHMWKNILEKHYTLY